MARRDDREYREYLREEQRSQPGCPARKVVLDQPRQATSVPAAVASAPERRGHDAGHEAVVEPSGRGLDPLQPAAANGFVPGDGHFGVTAKNVGLRQLLGYALLAGVDKLGLGPRPLDACEVFWLDGVTKNDAHAYWLWRYLERRGNSFKSVFAHRLRDFLSLSAAGAVTTLETAGPVP